jgi:hypothetical protein
VPLNGGIWSREIGPVRNRGGNPVTSRDNAVTLPLGDAVELQVTAKDVNHGFGIYDEAGHLMAQTQAMPGYVNRLVSTFNAPGTYHLLCMEFLKGSNRFFPHFKRAL